MALLMTTSLLLPLAIRLTAEPVTEPPEVNVRVPPLETLTTPVPPALKVLLMVKGPVVFRVKLAFWVLMLPFSV
jgi:hypothetical protein